MKHDRPGACVHRLHFSGHLPRMERIHPSVAVAGEEHDGRIPDIRAYVLVRRIPQEVRKLLRVFRAAVLRRPESPNLEILVSQHIEERIPTPDGAEKIWPLCDRRTHQQAPIGASANREPLRRSVMVGDQILRSREEIVEDILLVLKHRGLMPGLPRIRFLREGLAGRKTLLVSSTMHRSDSTWEARPNQSPRSRSLEGALGHRAKAPSSLR